MDAEVHCHDHEILLLSILSSLNNLPFYILKIYFNIVLLYTPRSSKWSLSCMLHAPLLEILNSVCTLPSYFFMICYWFILPSILSSSKWSVSDFPAKTFCALLLVYCMPFLSLPPWFVHQNNMWVQIVKLLMQFSQAFSLAGPYIFFSIMASDTCSLCSFLRWVACDFAWRRSSICA